MCVRLVYQASVFLYPSARACAHVTPCARSAVDIDPHPASGVAWGLRWATRIAVQNKRRGRLEAPPSRQHCSAAQPKLGACTCRGSPLLPRAARRTAPPPAPRHRHATVACHKSRRRRGRRRRRRRNRRRRRRRVAVTTSLVPLCSPLGRAHAVRPRCGHPAAAHAVMRHPTPSHRAAAAVAAVAVAAVARAAPPARQPTSKQDPPHRPAKPPLRARATVAAHHDTSDFGPWPHRGACARPTLRPEHGSACCARCQRRRRATLRARWACAAPQHARGYRHAHRRRRPRVALTFARVDAAVHGHIAASPRGLGLACGGASTPRARPGAAAPAPRRHSRRRWCGHAATHAATRARALLGASDAVLTR